jgi:hypothetical protein
MLKLKCRKHPRYTGLQSPRASCPPCYELHVIRNQAFANRLEVVEPVKKVEETQEEK